MMKSSRATEPKTQWELVKHFLRNAGYTLFGCFLIGLVIFWFRDDHSPGSFFWHVVYSTGYGGTIGALMTFVMPRVAPVFWRWPPWARWPALYATMLGLTAIGCLLAMSMFSGIGLEPWREFWPNYLFGLRIAVVICLIVGTASIAYERFRFRLEKTALELRTKELERQKALNAATAARLASLESRIHPHFLFNALNSISSLIPEDPVRAERLVEQMAALLRFSLDSNQTGLVPLEREIQIVAGYLDIEQARYGDRLRFTLSIPVELGHLLVPPLAVQTLVENSVKHAIAPRREGGSVGVTASRAGENLHIEVADDGPGFRPEAVTAGHGLDNLDARLAVLFHGAGKLNISRAGHRTIVSLLVPQPAAQTVEQP